MTTVFELRENQTPPEDAKVFLMAGGRSSGKTRAGVEWTLSQPENTIIIGPSKMNMRENMLEGESGLLVQGELEYISPVGMTRPLRFKESGRLVLPVAADQFLQTIAPADEFFGYPPTKIWIDEIGKLSLENWHLLNEMYPDAKFFIGFTPPTVHNELLTHLYRRTVVLPKSYSLKTSSTLDNVDSLYYDYIERLMSEYGNTDGSPEMLYGIYNSRYYYD